MTATDWDQVRTGSEYPAVGEALNARYGPAPAGARTDEYWGGLDAAGIRKREVYWSENSDGEVTVCVEGTQYSDGRIEPRVSLYFDDDTAVTLNPSVVRALVAAILDEALIAKLLDAADLVDKVVKP
jgi:hypothetical protein